MSEIANKLNLAVQAFSRGEILIVTDDDHRENEGDMILAATHCTNEKMAFIIRHTSGIVCVAMPDEEAKRLYLAPMVAENDSLHKTAFTVSVDYRYETTTGISAHDRTLTVRNLANPQSVAADFVRPGHVFPLIARQGGVLTRSGHTEAAVDLCKLAGLPPFGVLCELVNDDGTVMRGAQLIEFARKYKLHHVTVAELISWRQRQETLVERVATMALETKYGAVLAHSYQLPWEPMHHIALVFGDLGDGEDIPVRFCREDVLQDVFGRICVPDKMLQGMMLREKAGILVYLRAGSSCVGSEHDHGARSSFSGVNVEEEHDEALVREREWRHIGLGAQILKHLGVRSIRLLASKERHYVGLDGFGIRINTIDYMKEND